ncbi:MAG: hypothetical protein JO307_33440 [Bryobacterales bacterium]|nr:hypothetical protein [Bryobacterales bacterium]MBV9400983.1 hypothetical protein [Bryobacterales bacterium]
MTKSPARRAALAFLGAIFCVAIYRAWTQPFSHDEAFMWDRYLAAPAAGIFTRFAAENHFLHTLLAKLSQLAFGNSPFALRLPGLLAAAWFFNTIYRSMFRAAGETWGAVTGVALLALNPVVLDFLIICRGYGLALALFAAGLAQLVEYFSGSAMRRSQLWKAGPAIALSVTANLTFAVPSLAVSAIFAGLVFLDREDKRKLVSLSRFAASAGLVAAAFAVASPIRHARKRHFFVGAHSALQSLWNMIDIAIRHNSTLWIDWRNPPAPNGWTKLVAFVILPLVLAAFAIACAKLYPAAKRSGIRTLNSGQLLIILSGGILLIATVLLIGLHHLTGLLYPIERTGLYMQLLIGLLVIAIPSAFPNAGLGKMFGKIWIILPVAFVMLFVSQMETSYFSVWRYDADTRAMLDRIPVRKAPAQLGASWEFEPVINYYRRTSMPWVAPVGRSGPDGQYDFYMLTPWDQALLDQRGLKVVVRAPISQAVLAIAP